MKAKHFKIRLNKERKVWKCNQTKWGEDGQKRMVSKRSAYIEFSQAQVVTLNDGNTIFFLIQRGHLHMVMASCF